MADAKITLLTGPTGFLGGAVLAEELAVPGGSRFLCVARGADDPSARARVRDGLAMFAGDDAAAAHMERVDVVAGDMTDAATWADPRFDAVTHILHLAADTSYRSVANNRLVNVEGTRHLATRARAMPRLERMIYAGTAMICGRGAPPVVREQLSPSANADHVVYYTRTKAEAETMLATEFADLPVVVARPSIVAGHSTLGAAPSASIFWMFRAGDSLRVVSGDPEGGIDVVPVDWTARALLWLRDRPALRHRVYHLSAGPAKLTRWKDLGEAFRRCDPADAPRDYERIGTGEWRRLRARFEEVFGLRRPVELAMLRAMRAYYEFCALGYAFANDRLLEEGFAPPPSMPEYLAACLANPAGKSIVEQFADDLGMFEAPAAALSEARIA